jgi:dynactin 5
MNRKPRAKPVGEYIETDNGNRISRKSGIQGSQYIVLGGKSIIEHEAVIRGDLHRPDSNSPIVAIGRYCIMDHGCNIEPPNKISSTTGTLSRYPMKIGSYCHIGASTKVQSAQIGSCVYVGKNCILGAFSIIKDCVMIADDTVIPPMTVIPPFSVVQGNPGRICEDGLPETYEEVLELYMRRRYAGIDVDMPFREV